MSRYLLTLLSTVLTFFNPVCSQQFTDRAAAYGIQHLYGEGTAGGGISMADFNQDGLDDISMASSTGEPPHFYENTNSGLVKRNFLPTLTGEIKHLLWVDFDNDGDKDLFVTMADDYNRLYVNDGKMTLTDETEARGLPVKAYTSFGACWGDYNRDGWLDLYFGIRRIESDGLPNISRLFQNRNGKFTEATLASGTEDGGKTPFCSTFIDYNNDKWPDIYTAHDRKRGNTMLRNNKNGTFTNVSLATATDLKMDGMSVSTSDFNSDGYFDLYISNSEAGNALFVNQNGEKFRNQAAERGVGFFSVAWGTNFLDGDNDGDEDLYVSGMLPGAKAINSQYYVNLYPGDIFVKGTKIPADTASSFNNAIGDINDDGYADIGVMNVGPYPSFLFMNKGGTNRYIKLQLEGTLSNRDGIGSVITVYHGIRRQYRYTQCGIGFMGQNTDTEIFGLGNATKADSVIVTWPTGHVDRFYNLPSNQLHRLKEGSSTQGIVRVDADVVLLATDSKQPVHEKKALTIDVTDHSAAILRGDGQLLANVERLLVFSLDGTLVFTATGRQCTEPFSVEGWKSGIYIARIENSLRQAQTISVYIWN